MAAPTFVTEAESAWNTTTTPKTSASLSVQTGDVLLDCIADENFTTAENYTTTNSGTAQTWTEVRPTLTNNLDSSAQIHYAVSTVTESMTVTSTRTAGDAGDWWGKNVLQYRDSDGVGNTATSGTAQSVSITVSADSSIVAVVADWSAASWGGTRPWLTVGGVSATEMSYFNSAVDYTLGVARWEAVPAGTYTVGLTGLGGSGFCIAVVEVLGSAGGATVEGAAAASFGFTGTASGVPETFGTAAASLGFTGAAAGVDRAIGVALAALGFTATSTGVDRALGAAAAAFGGTFTAQGTADTPPVTGQAAAAFGGTFTGAGVDRALGQAAASFGGTLAAAAVRRALGQALAQLGFTAAAAGTVAAPPGTGTASGSFGFTATAQGVDRALGQAAATFGFTGSASGAPRRAGAAASAFGFTAAAAGVDQTLGVAVAALGFTGTAQGTSETPPVTGAAAAALVFTATASGRPRVVAVAVAAFGFTAAGRGVNLSIVTPPERTLVVPAEDRLLVVPAEGRVLLVPPNTNQET